ncbi:hypothetical protein [Fibrobacter sp. UWP2]|nr:hypothetical protein [Fibrobacter sp. UWP2]SHJ43347.1 hypothetical protein SAMN05720471_1392 [Fibrobacter sp. UWP2]
METIQANQSEQKKEYIAPTVKIVKLKQQSALLQCSTCNDDTIEVEFN